MFSSSTNWTAVLCRIVSVVLYLVTPIVSIGLISYYVYTLVCHYRGGVSYVGLCSQLVCSEISFVTLTSFMSSAFNIS